MGKDYSVKWFRNGMDIQQFGYYILHKRLFGTDAHEVVCQSFLAEADLFSMATIFKPNICRAA